MAVKQRNQKQEIMRRVSLDQPLKAIAIDLGLSHSRVAIIVNQVEAGRLPWRYKPADRWGSDPRTEAVSAEEVAQAMELRDSGMTVLDIAGQLSVAYEGLRRALLDAVIYGMEVCTFKTRADRLAALQLRKEEALCLEA